MRRHSLALLLLWPVAGHAAKPAAPDRPAILQKVMDCRGVADPTQRLACFDANVAAFASAEASRDVMVVDRNQVNQTRRQLFGYSIPKLSMFGIGGQDDDEAPKQVESTIQSLHRNSQGQWVIVLPDGAVWRQIDDNVVFHDPHVGSKVDIRRATLGTYFIRVDGQIGFRAERTS